MAIYAIKELKACKLPISSYPWYAILVLQWKLRGCMSSLPVGYGLHPRIHLKRCLLQAGIHFLSTLDQLYFALLALRDWINSSYTVESRN